MIDDGTCNDGMQWSSNNNIYSRSTEVMKVSWVRGSLGGGVVCCIIPENPHFMATYPLTL